MDNNNMFDKENQNGEQGQFQQPPYQQGPYQQSYQQQPYQQSPYQPPYQQQPYQGGDGELEEPVTFSDWMLTMLIMCIPCVNIVMMFVWAFGSNTKKSKSNYFKASLIWMLIYTVLIMVMLGVYGSIFISMMNGMY